MHIAEGTMRTLSMIGGVLLAAAGLVACGDEGASGGDAPGPG